MHADHFQQHLVRCQKWAEIYSTTGSYKEVDLNSLEQSQSDENNSGSLSSESPPSQKIRSVAFCPEIDRKSPHQEQSGQKLSQSSASSNKTSGTSSKTSMFEPEPINQKKKERHNLLWKLRQELKKFQYNLFKEFCDVLTEQDIEKEISKQFLKKETLLKSGFIEIENVLSFARKRTYPERRLLKMSMLPDIPTMDEVKIFCKHLHTNQETIFDWCDQRFNNDPRYYRSDKDQKHSMSVEDQIQLMTYIYENSQFLPKRDGIKSVEVSKVKNIAVRIFYR